MDTELRESLSAYLFLWQNTKRNRLLYVGGYEISSLGNWGRRSNYMWPKVRKGLIDTGPRESARAYLFLWQNTKRNRLLYVGGYEISSLGNWGRRSNYMWPKVRKGLIDTGPRESARAYLFLW